MLMKASTLALYEIVNKKEMTTRTALTTRTDLTTAGAKDTAPVRTSQKALARDWRGKSLDDLLLSQWTLAQIGWEISALCQLSFEGGRQLRLGSVL
jgi:hypothetical protein